MFFGKGGGVPIRGEFGLETVRGTVRALGPHTLEMGGAFSHSSSSTRRKAAN